MKFCGQFPEVFFIYNLLLVAAIYKQKISAEDKGGELNKKYSTYI